MINNSITRKNKTQKRNTTRKIYIFEKLNKCPRSRITGMESYKINCGKNLLLGYHTIKASEETSIHKDHFVHVVLSELKDYNKPVVVKVYDEDNFHLHIELNILKKITGFRNTAQLICDFSCNDDKNKYITKIKKQIRFCGDGLNKLHFFVYEYITYGDVSNFLTKTQEINTIKSLILQITCVIIQLASIYKIYHGDINSGNILLDAINERTIDYCIEGETFIIESQGIIPKIIDYGRSNFYKEHILPEYVWFDIIMTMSVIYPYIQNNELKQKVLDISKKADLSLPSLKDYYIYIHTTLIHI
jgi:serine/threonine protein kinase